MRRRAPSTLVEVIRRAIIRAIVVTIALAIGYGVTSLVIVTSMPSADVERPTAEHSPEWALDRAVDRDLVCWTSAAPKRYADAIPTHVIWQHVDGRTVVSSRLVDPALETLFADGKLDGWAIAFCHTAN